MADKGLLHNWALANKNGLMRGKKGMMHTYIALANRKGLTLTPADKRKV